MKKLLLLFLLSTSVAYTNDSPGVWYSGEVEFFEDEMEERFGAYTLSIKGEIYTYTYTVMHENGKYYFPIFEFLKTLNLVNYDFKDGVISVRVGENLDKVKINLNRMEENKDYIYEDRDYYLEENIFKEYFLQELTLNKSDYTLSIIPNFTLPEGIKHMLAVKEERLHDRRAKKTLYYKGERNLIDVGNLRVNLEQEFTNDTGVGNEKDWTGFLEYSGSLLYGNFTTDYDLKEKEFGDFQITYSDILNGHELDIGLYGEYHEKGLILRKEEGYFNDGKVFIINEKVPLGSKVELLFNGFPIDVEDEKGGEVTFTNNLIKSGREFTLKIYEPNGAITEKVIKINEDYNQQNQGEFGYDIDIRENHEADKYDSDVNIYYGYTENLTLGFAYREGIDSSNFNYAKTKEIGTEFIYSNSVDGNPFTFTYTFNKDITKSNIQDRENGAFQHKFLLDTDIKKWSINYEQIENSKHYSGDSKSREQYLELEYDLNDFISLTYDREDFKFHDGREDEEDYSYGLEFSKSFRNLLVNYEIENTKKGDLTQNLDFYYTGFRKFTVRMENSLDENGYYEGEVMLTNTTWLDNLDYSFGVKYNTKDRYVYSLEFTLKFDNWLELGSSLVKNGQKRSYVGIDRVLNLKNPTKNMNSLENTTIKAVAFFDKNNNNIYDKGEELLPDVDITLGKQTVTTNENGVAYIYGVPSHIDYELKVLSKRPSHDSNSNIIKVKGLGSSQVLAYIPIKPLVSIMGEVSFPKDESVADDVRIEFHNEIASYHHTIYTDPDGTFYLDSLTPGIYVIIIDYIGEDYNIKRYRDVVDLTYTNENLGENFHSFILEEEN